MQVTVCTRCKKSAAVVFVTKIENGVTTNEGLCLKCARELNIKPIQDVIRRFGMSDEELDMLTDEMSESLGGADAFGMTGDFEEGRTATFPFLNRLAGQNEPFPRGGEQPRPWQTPPQQGGNKRKKLLENYCISLTGRAREGKLDRVVGREGETERVVQILNRRQKNNPCLIGEPGVGKTAIAEGLAQRIVDSEVPYKLQDKEVYMLDLTALVAGTQFRGQFEGRMKGLVEEIKALGNIILVIDEVHSLVGAGDADGTMNAANILKPALSRGEIQVIGATTFNEYRKYIEKDSALERRFQPVTVNEPSIADSIEILRGIKHYYEEFHGVRVTDEIAARAVILSERYITDRFLPDKAIDLIDEACSDMNLRDGAIVSASRYRREKDDLQKEREMLLSRPEGNYYERLAVIRSRELQISNELAELERYGPPELTADALSRVIEQWTKIPAASIRADELERLRGLDARLKKRVIGQDEAVELVCEAIRRNRVGISAKRKPSSFIFIGSTGVGKTELVKRLAEDLFDSPESLIRLDMSEFMEKHSVSRIIGSPPGYVGYDEAGQLTEKIRRKPYSVVLLDEIEKAHPDVMNILLQILDDGRLTDAHGRVVNFENTVIIMTTNAGSDRNENAIGFNRSPNELGKAKSEKALKDFLRPEFINRVDEIVYFNRLTEESFKRIAGIMLDELRDSMAEKQIELSYDDSALAYLTNKSFSETYGARNLRRVIQKEVENAIASELISGFGRAFSRIGITAAEGGLQIIAV
ncbi:MAG: ATP-dependent Clp protease ATP-binding subunit [Oscillospiraceae bacterium]|jgi:ATP-dependent Clp protease ATP-binding subunit ClpA|nr:ATP-dependent Clp protease ATP-binding subunit [Oscillospiraceae bacterium]